MSLDAFSLVISIGVLVGIVGIVGIAVIRFLPALAPLQARIAPWTLPLAAVVAVAATLSSLVLSEHYDLPPCRLCWVQRIFTYPLAVVLPIAASRRDRGIRIYAIPLALLGAAVSTYHVLLERFPDVFESGSSCELANPCSIIWFQRFGFVTIAVGAGTCLLLIAALLAFGGPRPDQPSPAQPSPGAPA